MRLRQETSQNKAQEVSYEDSNMHVERFLSKGLSGSTVEEDAGGVAGRAVSSKPDKSNLVLSGSATISWLFGTSGPCSLDLW